MTEFTTNRAEAVDHAKRLRAEILISFDYKGTKYYFIPKEVYLSLIEAHAPIWTEEVVEMFYKEKRRKIKESQVEVELI